MAFNPQSILKVLEMHGVRFVVIGGLAATLHGAPTVTFDIDIIPDPSTSNLKRLSSALYELEARVRVNGVGGGLVFNHDAASLHKLQVLNLVTKFGDFDISFHPSGVPDFDSWDGNASNQTALGVSFRLASLEDVIRSKESADRPKDRAALPILRALLERQ